MSVIFMMIILTLCQSEGEAARKNNNSTIATPSLYLSRRKSHSVCDIHDDNFDLVSELMRGG